MQFECKIIKNKSTAFVDLVCDSRAELFMIGKSWLHDLDSAILSELTLPSYSKLDHCPRADRRGGGTALAVLSERSRCKQSVFRRAIFI